MVFGHLKNLMQGGTSAKYSKGELIHSLDFKDELYLVNTGYVKRYSVTRVNTRSVQAIYGPGYFFPLTPVFDNLLHLKVSEVNSMYLYEAVTDAEIWSIDAEQLVEAVAESPYIYADLLYEAGRRLKSNIHSLENSALDSDHKKIAHQLVYIADEFGDIETDGATKSVTLPFKLTVQDLAEHLNLPEEAIEKAATQLRKLQLIKTEGKYISVPDLHLLRDVYL